MSHGKLPHFRRILVEKPEDLPAHVQYLGESDAIGLDVEMAQTLDRLPGGITKGRQILALIQISSRDLSIVLDPLKVPDIVALQPLMGSEAVKVVLGGSNDIQLLEEHGLKVRNVADLAEMAVSVFGHKEEGMRALANRALDIQIDKSIRREDWMRRPIDPVMLNYAFRDSELTLTLYRWFQEHYPNVVTSHVRVHYTPAIPDHVASWIQKYLKKRIDAARLFKEEGIDPGNERTRLVLELREAMDQDLSPGQQRRLIRLAGDVPLPEMYPDVLGYADSPSSSFRSAAARAIGRMKVPAAEPVLQSLLTDHVGDVAAAAEIGLRDLKAETRPKPDSSQAIENEPAPSLNPTALDALEQLRSTLSGDGAANHRDEPA